MDSTNTHTTEPTDGSAAPQETLEPTACSEQEQPPVVLIMHASVGSGHRSAAKAIAQAFDILTASHQEGIPENLETEVLDILDWGRIKFDGDKTASLFTGFTRPIYDLTWRYTFTGRLLWGGGTIWSRIMFPALTEHVRKRPPLAVICTHITAANAAVGARMLSGQNFPIVCVPTDYETEGLWPHLHSDLFCVASESMAETLRPRKVPEERILITGIPTREDFRKSYDKTLVRAELGLPEDKQIVLALAGAYLPRPYIRFRETLDEILPYLHTLSGMHVAIVAGNDEEYARHLRAAVSDLGLGNVTVFDYVEQMAALMAASDLVICKSGGLTVTECLCARVPMILLGKAYGQENINVRTLTALGAAMHVTTARELVDALRHISRNPQSVDAMLINGSFLRRPDAARDIAKAAIALAQKPPAANDPTRKKRFMHFYWGKKPAHIR
ncbi:MAG TPA: UDP-N-acetylglucosamine 2-epimerase [Candidatus Aphodovivens excrementavium]|nr:UDP-N-acetylglucosamine 2-epimerase [Candidatus Aphodovivens excrementavium]